MRRTVFSLLFPVFFSCNSTKSENNNVSDTTLTAAQVHTVYKSDTNTSQSILYNGAEGQKINTGSVTPSEIIEYSKTLIGTPYKYGSIDPSVGFDCSGFITYVFNHFKIAVPRSSIDFTKVPTTIPLQQAKPGDLILFTGTDSAIREVGHMGIIVSADDSGFQFIHSSSGKANAVTITPLNPYYMGRFMKVIRVFDKNND